VAEVDVLPVLAAAADATDLVDVDAVTDLVEADAGVIPMALTVIANPP
jgi:hypothetical protein